MGIIDELELEDMESDKPRDMTEAEIQLVIAKTQAGQFTSAARNLSSLGTLEGTPEVVEKLKNLHPDGLPNVCPEVSHTYVKQTFAKEAIEKAIISFPSVSSYGPSGMTPDHLKCVVLLNVRTATSALFTAQLEQRNLMEGAYRPGNIFVENWFTVVPQRSKSQ
jgi:hypothetical protein